MSDTCATTEEKTRRISTKKKQQQREWRQNSSKQDNLIKSLNFIFIHRKNEIFMYLKSLEIAA